MEKILEAVDIYKSYGNQRIINGVSLFVSEGEFVSLVGESGAGKSTLLYLLAGIVRPDSGTVKICGEDIYAMKKAQLAKMRATTFGFVFQFDNLLPNLTIRENILLPRYISKTHGDEAEKYADYLLDYMDISDTATKRPSEVSGGQQQRASIARALIINPKILFLDEPTGSLDKKSSAQIIDLLKKINVEKGVSILQVTHSGICARAASRVISVSDGTLSENDGSLYV